MPAPLLILGASARAASFSAIRAGFDPIAVDLFADVDLSACCPARRVDPSGYPDLLPGIAAEQPSGPWMYTGALENHPGLVDRIADDRPLWGNSGETLRLVRDPIALADALRSVGLPAPEVTLDPTGLPRDGSWLVKPIRSASGAGIRPLDRQKGPGQGVYFQRRLSGPSGSAVFIGEGNSARLVEVTRQWIGHPGSPFGYLGSEGPVPVPIEVRRQLDRTGDRLAVAFGLRGLFAVDFVLQGGIAWPTEVNPRYSASVEVIESVTGRLLILEHARAFGFDSGFGAEVQGYETCIRPRNRYACKVILFATNDLEVPSSHRWSRSEPIGSTLPPMADLPPPGSSIRAGQPVLTLLEEAGDRGRCRRRLARRLDSWRETLRLWSIPDG